MVKKKDKSRGQSMVELALILPIVLLVVLGIIEFGRAFFIYTVVSGAAREGARYGITQPKDLAGITAAARSRLVLLSPNAVAVDVTWDDGSNPIPDYLIKLGKSRVVVEVQTQFTMITPIISSIFPETTIRFVSARTTQDWVKVTKPTPVP